MKNIKEVIRGNDSSALEFRSKTGCSELSYIGSEFHMGSDLYIKGIKVTNSSGENTSYAVNSIEDLDDAIISGVSNWEILSDIVLDGTKTIPNNTDIKFKDGSITLGDYNFIGDDSMFESTLDHVFIYNGTGRVTGTWKNIFVRPENFGAVGNGVADDSGAINYALDFPNNIVKLQGLEYFINSEIQIKNTNQILEGDGEVVLQSSETVKSVIEINPDTRKYYGTSENISIEENNAKIDITGITASVGDIISMRNSVQVNNKYDGIYSVIENIDGNIATLSTLPYKSFVADVVEVFSAISDIKISGIEILLGSSTVNQYGINGTNVINPIIYDVKVKGEDNNAIMGIALNGFKGIVSKCNVERIYDELSPTVGRTGYGIHLAGHDMTASFNKVSRCKHCLSVAKRTSMSTGIDFLNNEVFAFIEDGSLSNLSLIDLHPNARGRIAYNKIQDDNPGFTISVREGGSIVEGNDIYISNTYTGTIKTIASYDSFSGDTIIKNNIIYGGSSGVSNPISIDSNVECSNVTIDNNTFDYGKIDISNAISNVTITNNEIKDAGQIFIESDSENVDIVNNKVKCLDTGFQLGIYIKSGVTDVRVLNNEITHQLTGGNPIRILNSDANIVKGNLFNLPSVSTSAISDGNKSSIIEENRLRVISTGVISDFTPGLYTPSVTALPTASVTYRNKQIIVSNAGALDTLHVCLKQANDSYAWTQII